MLILGIETSCDETGIALVKGGREVISESLVTQIDIHSKYGGVVPELAARQHAETIDSVLNDMLNKTEIELRDIDGIAVTYGPGLPGALLVGIAFAKGLAYSLRKPLIPVNHLEAHLESANLQYDDQVIYPGLGLIVSGGHTTLLDIEKPGKYRLIGKTRDDAAGEAYDKVAKLMNLGYPGGPVIDKLAKEGDPKRFRFKRPRFSDGSRDFSFSGIKTAVMRLVKDTPEGEINEKFIIDLAASFQFAVVRNLTRAVEESFTSERHKSIIITGGVAVNSALRISAKALAERLGVPLFIPDACYCTDNGIMVAALGARLLTEGKTVGLELDAEPDLKIGEAPGKRKSLRYRQ